ncbi:SufS family cysteine desulfurase [Candidatus Pacearchaeota archaeon]|nr:SufS family cysteine desulfurase [Candidatus Pacearchaeota archaeon]
MTINNSTAKKLKDDFPIFKNNKNLVYLDNAATTQKPKVVIEKIKEFYENSNANASRGIYSLAEKATEEYEKARKIAADFIDASSEEIIFTKNATDSINSIAYSLESAIPNGRDEILLTEMEHHSNLIPWQQLAKRKNMKLRFIKIKSDFTLDMEDAKSKITEKTAIVSFVHVSNALGTLNDAKAIANLAKTKNAFSIIDATQSVPHMKVDVKNIDCDFLVFSSHKMLGPAGIGILYGKKELLEKIPPFSFGGGMIKSVSYENAEFAELPEKFEAGTQNIADASALGEAIRYLEKIGIENISSWEKQLLGYALEKLKKMKGVEIYNPGIENSSGIISFNIKGIHPHDAASLFDSFGIAVRAGHHCCMPLMKKLGLQGTIRISFYLYNAFEDIDKLIEAIKKIKEKFGK